MEQRSQHPEEDRLDWLENAGRPPSDLRGTDAAFITACVGLALVVVGGIWLVRRVGR
jgi:hypothetical protein